MAKIVLNTEYLNKCSGILGGIIEDNYKTLEIITNMFFTQAGRDYSFFADISQSEDTYCSFYSRDASSRMILKGKKNITLPDLKSYTTKLKKINNFAFKKHVICYTIFLFNTLEVDITTPESAQGDQPNNNETLYDYINNDGINPTIVAFIRIILNKLEDFQTTNNADIKYEFCEYIKKTAVPTIIAKDIERRFKELLNLINADRFNEIKIEELFKIKSQDDGEIYEGLLKYLDSEEFKYNETDKKLIESIEDAKEQYKDARNLLVAANKMSKDEGEKKNLRDIEKKKAKDAITAAEEQLVTVDTEIREAFKNAIIAAQENVDKIEAEIKRIKEVIIKKIEVDEEDKSEEEIKKLKEENQKANQQELDEENKKLDEENKKLDDENKKLTIIQAKAAKYKLEKYIESLNIPTYINLYTNGKIVKDLYDNRTLSDILAPFHAINCTEVREDILTGIEFSALTINELNTFLNYNNSGYCYTYDFIALKMINERSNPKLDTETSYKYLAMVLAKYYIFAATDESLNDFLRAYNEMMANYAGNDKIFEQLKNMIQIKDFRTKLLATAISYISYANYITIVTVFEYILDPEPKGLAAAIESANIQALCKYSIGTIFDLIGLFGYTLLSDDISVGENTDGSHFFIAKNCSLILLDLFENLNKIEHKSNSNNTKTLKTLLLAINFKYVNLSGATTETSIGDILYKMQNTCIHGVGNSALQYFFLALKVKNTYINKLKGDISWDPKDLGKAVDDDDALSEEKKNARKKAKKDAIEELILYGYQADGKDTEDGNDRENAVAFLNETFRNPPFILDMPKKLANKGIAYLTCIRDDKIENYSPLCCVYSIIGYTIDGQFGYLVKVDSRSNYIKDESPNSALDFLNNSESNDRIRVHGMCTNDKVGAEVATYLEENPNYLKELIKISYVFQRNRVPLFKVYKEYVLNVCKVMSDKIDTINANVKAKKLLNRLYNKKQFDIINMEDTNFPVKYLTGIVIPDKPDHSAHLYGNSELSYNAKNAKNANVDNTDPNSIQNNSKYYVTTLDNIANLKYVPYYSDKPEDIKKGKAIIKLPETGQDITRPFHYAKLLASMLYPDMYFSECLLPPSSTTQYEQFANHVQKKWSLFESYYHNVNGQASQFRQLMFSNISFTYKLRDIKKENGEIEKRGDTITKTKGQFSRMKYKIGGVSQINKLLRDDISKIKANPDDDASKKIIEKFTPYYEDIFDYFENIDAINAPIILGKIIYKFNNLTIAVLGKLRPNHYGNIDFIDDGLLYAVNNTILNIINNMRFWMTHTIHYFKSVLPANGYLDEVNTKRWTIKEDNGTKTSLNIEWVECAFNQLASNKNFDAILGRKYYLILEELIDIIIQHGYNSPTYQYHFTEIQKELYLIKYLSTKFKDVPPPNETSNLAILAMNDSPQFVQTFKDSYDVIKDIIPYYKEKDNYYNEIIDKDDIFKRDDYQECIRIRFEYLLKIQLVKMHEARMQQYAYYENLLANIYKNKNEETGKIISNTIEAIEDYIGDPYYESRYRNTMQDIFDEIQNYPPPPAAQAAAPAAELAAAAEQALAQAAEQGIGEPIGEENAAPAVAAQEAQLNGLVIADTQDKEFAQALLEIINNLVGGIDDNETMFFLSMRVELEDMIHTNVFDKEKLLLIQANLLPIIGMNLFDD